MATDVLLRDMHVDVPPADSHRIEVLANWLPLWQVARVAVDIVDVFGKLNVKNDDNSAFRDDCRALRMRDTCERSRTHCERLVTKAIFFWSPPGPLDPNLNSGTLRGAFKNRKGKG